MPLKVTLTLSASEVESGTVSFGCKFAARLLPKIDTNEPGATPAPGVLSKLAAFKTPPSATTGVWQSAAPRQHARNNKVNRTNLIDVLILMPLSGTNVLQRMEYFGRLAVAGDGNF